VELYTIVEVHRRYDVSSTTYQCLCCLTVELDTVVDVDCR